MKILILSNKAKLSNPSRCIFVKSNLIVMWMEALVSSVGV